MQKVYLDNAATTFLHPDVIAAMQTVLETVPGNPSSLHQLGVEAEQVVNKARAQVAKLLAVRPEELYFTSGGTEANNLAIKGVLHSRSGQIVTTTIEHPSVREVVRALAARGRNVVTLPVNRQGEPDLALLDAALKEPTALISVMAVNNETGQMLPVEEIAKIVREKSPKTLIHVDAVQAPAKLLQAPGKLDIDMFSVSAHKIHGPKGVGALWVRRRDWLEPLFHGGGQEGSLRSGTENVSGIAGFGAAGKLAANNARDWVAVVERLRQRFVQGLEKLPCRLLFQGDCVPHIVAVAFPGFQAEILLQALSARGVYVSAGAACSGKKGNLSHVSQALGLTDTEARGVLRFSFSAFNTETQIDYALTSLENILDELAFVRGRSTRSGR
ncbi:MAG: cysteine desulfurase [Firmicutes bacterium]|nr:cysteine desulfurase [Bacillota bacterium]